MPRSFLIIVTGLPASGKTTLARRLSERYAVPVLGKDLLKEPLMEVLGPGDGQLSRRLSDASFRALLAVASELVRARVPCILEGNFRAGEHDALVRPLFALARGIQILCRIDEQERLARLRVRASDASRHPGHRDLEQAALAPALRTDTFLELPGERVIVERPESAEALLQQLDGFVAR